MLWILVSVVAWVSHLGRRVPPVARFLAGKGAPHRAPARALGFWRANGPPALAFVVPHSALPPPTLARLGLRRHARLAYALMAAAALHWFVAGFVPHDSPVVLVLPLPPRAHAALSLGALAGATAALVAEPRTWGLLGVPQALAAFGAARAARPPPPMPPPAMDVITWQAACVCRAGGAGAFVAFSGLSILPRDVTVSDFAVRASAALYLRCRSRGFRGFVTGALVARAHLLTWALRLALVLGALAHADARADARAAWSPGAVLAAGAALALALRAAETRGGGGAERGKPESPAPAGSAREPVSDDRGAATAGGAPAQDKCAPS